MSKNFRLVNFRIPEEWNEKLERLAEKNDRTKSYIIRKIIKRYLDENSGKWD